LVGSSVTLFVGIAMLQLLRQYLAPFFGSRRCPRTQTGFEQAGFD